MMNQPRNSWVATPRPNPAATHRLFCFSYAGGGTAIYSSWPAALPAWVEMCAIRLPGRESRMAEKPFTSVSALVPPLIEGLRPFLDKPFLFFGHSLGGFVAYETIRQLRHAQLPLPQKLFVSGTRAPHLPDPEPPIHNLPDPEFIAELRRLNGTPEAVLANEELLALVLPYLRADFSASETYTCEPHHPLNIPITAFGGQHDPKASREQLEGWQVHTHQPVLVDILPGDHFFIHSEKEVLLQKLTAGLFS